MKREINVAPSRVFDVCDWRQRVGDGRIVFTPSEQNLMRSLWITLLAAVVIGVVWWVWGLPPGSARAAREQRDIDALNRQIERIERDARRLSTSAGTTGQRMAEQRAEQAQRQRDELERRRAALVNSPPTLGPAYNALVWGVVGVSVLVGLGAPLLCLVVRAELSVEGEFIVFRRTLERARRYPIASFVGVKPLAKRWAGTATAHTHAYDHGWLWDLAVIADADRPLPPGSPQPRTLVFRVELNKTLPAGRSMLPGGAANIARLLQDHAGLHCSGATTGEFAHRPTGFLGMTRKVFRRRDAPPPDLDRLPPLD